MIILSELRETYWGADFTIKMFERAQAKLAENPHHHPQRSPRPSTSRSANEYAPVPLTPESSAYSQVQSATGFPSVDDLLTSGFVLAEPYMFGMNDVGLE